MSGPKPTALESRLYKWRIVDETTGCWLWSILRKSDYGRITFKGKKQLIHRLSAFVFLGLDESSTMQVNHKPICPNKGCFNPDHLYIGTAQDNSNDYSNSKTHCINGHELSGYNIYVKILKSGPRKGQIVKNCRECGKLNARRLRASE